MIKKYKGKAEEFIAPIREYIKKINTVYSYYISFDINDITNFEKKESLKEEESDELNVKFDVPISITYKKIDGSPEVKKFALNNVYGINKISKPKDSEEEEEEDDKEDDKITSTEFWNSIKDDKIVRDAILKKPGFFSRLFGFYRGKGIKPAEDTLRKLATLSNNDKLDYPGNEFETGKIITGAFIQPNIGINSIIPINEKFKSMVAKASYTDIKIKLWTNLKLKNSEGFTNTKYKIILGNKIESVDGEYDVYEVIVLNRKPKENEKENLGKSKLKITNYGKKK